MIDDGPYNRLNSSVSGGLYKWEIELEKKLRLFTPQLKKVSADKMLEFINERKLSSHQKKAILIAIQMSGNMTGATKKIEKMKKGLSKDKKVKDALRLANESINEKMGPEQYHRYLQYVFDTQFKTSDEKKMKKSMIKKINKAQKKKGLPIFKEGLGDKFQKNIKKYQDRIEKEREAYKKAREAQKKRNNESVNEVSGVDVAKKVLKNKQMEKGIDLQTANLIVTIDKAYDKNPKLQKKFRKIQLPRMKQLIIKYYG
jgi:hypothetical protein